MTKKFHTWDSEYGFTTLPLADRETAVVVTTGTRNEAATSPVVDPG